jgi:putative flippase GtrA
LRTSEERVAIRQSERWVFLQLIKYGTVGAAGTAAQFATLICLVEGFGSNAVVASTIGAIAGAFVNYMLNYHYTFRSSRPHMDSLVKYFVVSAAGIALNALALVAATSFLGLHYVSAQILATVIVFFAAFAVNRAWTF